MNKASLGQRMGLPFKGRFLRESVDTMTLQEEQGGQSLAKMM